MVETRNAKEVRLVRELFDMVGQLAQVVVISSGQVMSFAVQIHGDASLFTKIEWLLKSQFSFSMVERNFSEVTFHLVRSLCADADAKMAELPECGICGSADPFPTRATVEWDGDRPLEHLAYCTRCSARNAEVDPAKFIRGLVRRDQRHLNVADDVQVVQMPGMVDERSVDRSNSIAAVG